MRENLQKSADYNIYVRDRSPYVRFTGKAYVLPRTGQRGIPVVSVNTSSVQIQVHRIGDRSLIDTVFGNDFQRNIDRYDRTRIGSEKGTLAWKGDMKIESVLNADVTTAFPVDQAIGDLKPGVYVMTAEPEGTRRDEDYGQLATQWFIVSDLGLTAFSGNDGINVFINSLATTEAKAGIEVRLIARNNEVLATRTTDAAGFARFEAGLARGEGGLAPAMIVADGKSDYAFLSLKGPAFDLTDRGVAGRSVTAGLDAFVYAERGVYRTGETVHLTTLLRDSKGVAVTGVPMTLVIERPDGVEYRRTVVQDQGVGGRALSFPMISSAPTGTYRVRAYTDPKGPSVGATSFLVEDYVPDRMEFDLASPTGKLSQAQPAEVTVDGRFLYGAPASNLALEGEMKIRGADAAARLPRLQFRRQRRRAGDPDRADDARGPPRDRRRRQGEVHRLARQDAGDLASARGADHRAAGRVRRPRGRAQSDAPDRADRHDDRRQAAVLRALARRGRKRGVRRDRGIARRQAARRERPALRTAQGRAALSVLPPRRALGVRAGQEHAPHRGRPHRRRRRQARPHRDAGDLGPLPARRRERRPQHSADVGDVRRRLLRRRVGRHAGPARDRARQVASSPRATP